jgi:predicted GIY-YIG superfamily endonuclease
MTNTLYRIFNADGELLYVGATVNPSQRFQVHGGTKPWWEESASMTMQHLETWEELVEAEIQAIKTESPKYNTVHSKQHISTRKPRVKRGSGSFYRRSSDGLWIGKVSLPPGPNGKPRYRTVSSTSRAEAELKFAQLKSEVASKVHPKVQ